MFVQGSQDVLQCFRIDGPRIAPSPVSTSTSAQQYSRIGLALSANGSNLNTGILWETTGNYNDNTAPGTLHAYQASDLSVELWNSDMNSARDSLGAVSKFTSPTVANGKVYVATFANRMDVYGVLAADGPTPAPSVTIVANAASYEQDAVSPGEMISIFGANLGPGSGAGLTLDSDGIVATSLADTRVLFDGVPAPVLYASTAQVNAVVPFGIPADSTTLTVEYLGQSSDATQISVAPATPGIFSANGSGSGAAILVNQDGSINSADNPAAPGSVVTLYATGTGPLAPLGPDGSVVGFDTLPQAILPIAAQVGGVPASVLYAGGSPGLVEGVLQVNLQIPDTAGPGIQYPWCCRPGIDTARLG